MKISGIGILVCMFAVSAGAQSGNSVRYVVMVDNGTIAGEQTVEHRDDGLTKVHFVYKHNLSHTELDEQYRVGPDGTYTDYHVTGISEYGAPVDEQFIRTTNHAVWKSTSERGEKTLSGVALYVPLNGTFEANSVAITSLAARADGKLALLPGGTLTQQTVDEVQIDGEHGSRRVALVAQTGLGLSPAFYWTTTGSSPRLFAAIAVGFRTTIEAGFEGQARMLEARQKVAETNLLTHLAMHLMRPMPGLTVVRNARVFDSEHAILGAPSDVYVLRGRIAAVLPAGSPERGAEHEIDAGGRVLLPGLFDMHTHNDRWDGGLQLAAGVTTVRDMGGDNATVQQRISEVEAGGSLAPQIVPAGLIEGESPYSWRAGFVVTTLAQAKDAVDWYAEHGYPQIKIYNSFPKAILRETVVYAHTRGMRVSGHVPAFLRAEDVVDDGYDEIQHITHVLLNFLVTPETDTRTLQRFELPAAGVAGLDFDSKPVQDFIGLLKQHEVVVDPTLTTFDFLRQRDGEMSEAYAAVADHMPPDIQRSFRVGIMKIPPGEAARYEKSYEKMIEFVGRMYRAGIPLLAGTDALAGFSLQRELELYVKAGLTPAQVLQIATWNGAKYTRTLADRGSITLGKRADLVLVDGEPTKDIADLRKVVLVITQGKLVSPRDVDQALGIVPFVSYVPSMRDVAVTTGAH